MVPRTVAFHKKCGPFCLFDRTAYGTLNTLPQLAMWSLDTLEAINAEIEAKAKQKRLEPYQPSGPEEIEAMPPFPIPNLGHVPDGWEETESFWVDKTGWGKSSEPALTVEQFRSLLYDYVADNPDHAYAITEDGQFQLIVSALRRVRFEATRLLNP